MRKDLSIYPAFSGELYFKIANNPIDERKFFFQYKKKELENLKIIDFQPLMKTFRQGSDKEYQWLLKTIT